MHILDTNRNNCYHGKDVKITADFRRISSLKINLFLREKKIEKVQEKTSESPLRFIVSAR